MMAGPSAVTSRRHHYGGGSFANHHNATGATGNISQTHRDVTDDRYRDLRKPRRVRFFCNGDRYFKGKKMFITPHRYLTFNDLLNDLTGKLPSSVHLPYGVRTIYSPVGGSRIKDIESLQDGENYVVAGFETFRSISYGKNSIEPWSHAEGYKRLLDRKPGKPHSHDFYSDFGQVNKAAYGAFQPSRPIRPNLQTSRRLPGGPGQTFGTRTWTNKSETSLKPKVITVVRHSRDTPRTNVKILLNRRTVQSYEQMMKDISEAFGPKWKNNKVKKLFTLKGKEVQGVSEFFRDEEVFIAVGNEPLSSSDISEVIQEVYSDHPNAKTIVKDLEKKKRRAALVRQREKEDSKDDATTASKRDSGFGSDSSNRDEGERDEIYYEGLKANQARIEKERNRAADAEREKARKKMQKRLEAEQRSLEEEKRRKGLLPLKPIQERDSFRKVQEEREMERRRKDAERRLREAEERARREEADRRQKKNEAKVIVVVKEDGTRKKPVSHDGYESDDDISGSPGRKPKASPRPISDSDSEDERARKIKEEEEKLARLKAEREAAEREKEERERKEREEREEAERKEREERERKEREAKEKEEKERLEREKKDLEEKLRKEAEEKKRKEEEAKKKKRGGKTKMERQISNVSHVMAKYDAGKTLGDGNFAIVKQCKPKDMSGPDYAMKIIDKSKLKGKEHMIENEIEIMRLCDHPNIVKLVDEYETKDEIYLIMELVKGGDLFDAITQSVKFKEDVASNMVSDLANALFYLHSRHIVHRDLKPENLLVCRNRDGSLTLKLADFGLAMEVVEPIFTVCGTPTYVAPEILSEIGYGLEVDMWAVGVITYILLCGFPPFRSPDRNQTELFEFIKAGEFEYLSPYWDNISSAAKDLITHLLVVNKAKRYTAIDTLCHPWVITRAGTLDTPVKMDEYRRNLRRDLDIQAKANRENYLARPS